MNQAQTITVLNRILHVLCRSLPAYLKDAQPWTRPEEQQSRQALAALAADEQAYAQRVAKAIVARDTRPDPGRFPIEFAAVNDLGFEYLLETVAQRHRHDVAALERCAADLAGDPLLRALAEEIAGNAKKHLEILAGLSEEG
jgi:hypothetical protein